MLKIRVIFNRELELHAFETTTQLNSFFGTMIFSFSGKEFISSIYPP